MEKQNLKEKTKVELLSMAAKLEISGRHTMTKEALSAAIQKELKKTRDKKIAKPAKPKPKAVAKKKQVVPAKKSAPKKSCFSAGTD